MPKGDSTSGEHLATVRETVESVAIAIVLAFVLRAFVVEAFVIPTGSMAPRLMGQHWQFDCPACGYHYAFGYQQPVAGNGNGHQGPSQPRSLPVCPTCRHEYRDPKGSTYSGDRVLVLKYLYRLREPRPWDVVVFKNPQDNEQNYIKRLIGVPGHMIEIVHGDVYFRQGEDLDGDGVIDEADFSLADEQGKWPWRILRKPHKTQKVMWQVVFDNDYQPDPQVYSDGGMAQSWESPWQESLERGAWNIKDHHGGRTFKFEGSQDLSRLEFSPKKDWECFYPNYAYNSQRVYDAERDVGYDLMLSFQFAPDADDARVGLELSSFEHHFRGWVGADGVCVLEHGPTGQASLAEIPRARIDPLEKGRGYDVALTHVDRKVTLWVNGKRVLATSEQDYPDSKGDVEAAIEKGTRGGRYLPPPTVAILARGGAATLGHVRLMRDVYYTGANVCEGDTRTAARGHGTAGNPIVLRKFLARPEMDEFYVLGDNSPASKDSRMWGDHAQTLRDVKNYRNGTVPRYNMIGKAFFVYWPGGFRVTASQRSGLRLVPNVGRMRLIR